MIRCDKKYTGALKRIMKRADYQFLIKAMRALSDNLDPWYDYDAMINCIKRSSSPCKRTLALLQAGVAADYNALCAEVGRADVDLMVEAGIWRHDEKKIATDNLVALTYQGVTVLTEINPWYKTCQNRNTDVYIGSDSLRLAENIVFDKDAVVLDLCSGTGIQGILAARSAKKVVSVELNPKAVPVTRFNIALNGLEDVIDLRQGDLYTVIEEGERFDYIYANPPFIPMLGDVAYPICGAGGEDGLMVLDRIVRGLPETLKPDGEALIFCECLGDQNGVFFDERLKALGQANGWRINAHYRDRILGELQIPRMAKLTALFGELDVEDFIARMKEIYRGLGAKYLYSMLYKIDVCGEASFRRVNSYNLWDDADGATVSEGLTLVPNPDSQAVMLEGDQIGAFNNETVDVLSELRSGKSVRECAEARWGLYQHKPKYQAGGYPAFLSSMLGTCLKMEAIGAIQRKPKQ